MAASVSFGCTALVGTNKRGLLKCDGDGYYPVVLGALNHYNSVGAYYPLEPARALFEASSSLMRRIGTGALNGECGHPRKQPGQSDRDFAMRLNDIYEPNISHHIRKVWLDADQKDDHGRPTVFIMGEVKPSGPRGPALKEALEDRHSDVCFSIRSFTQDMPVGGVWHKCLRQIVTWDWVNEPGISAAHKWRAPALESLEDGQLGREVILSLIGRPTLPMEVAMESQMRSLKELADSMGWLSHGQAKTPPSASW